MLSCLIKFNHSLCVHDYIVAAMTFIPPRLLEYIVKKGREYQTSLYRTLNVCGKSRAKNSNIDLSEHAVQLL